MPSLIEIQTFTSDAVRIVNDRPLTSLDDKSNVLAVITPSSFLGQGLAPNTHLSAFHDGGTCVVTSFTIQLWLINFDSVGCKVTSLLYMIETSGGLLGIISALARWSWLEMLRTSKGAGIIAWAVYTECNPSDAKGRS